MFRGFSRASTTQSAESDCGLALSVTLGRQELHYIQVQISVWSLWLGLGAILLRVREVSLGLGQGSLDRL